MASRKAICFIGLALITAYPFRWNWTAEGWDIRLKYYSLRNPKSSKIINPSKSSQILYSWSFHSLTYRCTLSGVISKQLTILLKRKKFDSNWFRPLWYRIPVEMGHWGATFKDLKDVFCGQLCSFSKKRSIAIDKKAFRRCYVVESFHCVHNCISIQNDLKGREKLKQSINKTDPWGITCFKVKGNINSETPFLTTTGNVQDVNRPSWLVFLMVTDDLIMRSENTDDHEMVA